MKFLLSLIFFISINAIAQTPTINPSFFSADQEITITYDVTGTSLQSKQEAWIWMWLPGKSIDAPSNVNPASSNTSKSNPAKCTRSTDNTGRVFFTISLTPADFLGVSAQEIESIGMLLKGNDWADGQTDDYITEITNGFTLVLDNPSTRFGFFQSVQEITISGQTSESATIEVLVDDVSIASFTDVSSFTTTHTIIDDGLVHDIKVTGTNGVDNDEKKYSYTITPTPEVESIPEGLKNGINYIDVNSVTLVLEAPNKEHVFVISELNGWSIDADYLMKKDGEKFWITIPNLESGKEYQFQYLVDGAIRIADPYSEKISSAFDDGEIIAEERYPNLKNYPNGETSEAVSFIQTNKASFEWADFQKPANEDLIIYELLIRDFTDERTYDAVIEKLDYLQDLGINAIELMPVQEFEGNLSWGYNPSSMFAIDKYYGTELDLKTLINESHKRGMAIILDIVLNHQFGRNSLVRLYNEGLYGKPSTDNPWFNVIAKHDFNVGYDMNHESQYTKDYTDRVVEYWIEEYNIDGYRFDLSKGFTQKNSLGNVGLWGNYDATRVAIWKRIADVIWNVDPEAYIILEHFADNSEEKELADYGMMLWGNANHTFINAGKGSSTSLGQLYHENRGWNKPNLVGYMESHDEERFMWSLIKSGKTTKQSLDRAKLATAFFLTVPGPKMIWQFGEMGYDEELNNDRLGIKPTHWEYLDDPDRAKLYDLYKSLTNLRTKTNYVDKEYFSWSPGTLIKTINISHPDVEIYIVGNFDRESQSSTHNFSKTGTWFDYFTGEEIIIDDVNAEFTLASGQFKFYTSKLIDNYIDDGPIILSTEESNSTEIFVYPNPSKDEIRVIGNVEVSHFSISDLSGKIVIARSEMNENSLNVESLHPGIYYLFLEIDGKKYQKKIIKN